MPSQLYNNDAVEFICARNFLYGGVEYKLGETFPQEKALNLETLVRSRRVIPVVENRDDKPRHWFREIREKSEVLGKLKTNQGSSLLNGPVQIELDRPADIEPGELDLWDETVDNAAEIKRKQARNIKEDKDMGKQKVTLVNGKEESEPLDMIAPQGFFDEEPKIEVKEVDEAEPVVPKGHEKRAKETNNGLADPGVLDIEEAAGKDEGFSASSGGWNVESRDPKTAAEISDSEGSYDPAKHGVVEVNEYLADADQEEYDRVLDAEREGKNRKGIVGDDEE